MVVADVFKCSAVSRSIDWRTNYGDDPVIVQFGASNSKDMADCAQLVAPYCNGVDINCGCPQKWAIGEGIGCALMRNSELVADMIDQVKRRTAPLTFKSSTGTGFPCSVKIRVHKDIKQTIEFARRAEKSGADWISVHGRTQKQRSYEPVDLEAIKIIKESGINIINITSSIYTCFCERGLLFTR
jgi:tRNA-dihydrouridine synthase 4